MDAEKEVDYFWPPPTNPFRRWKYPGTEGAEVWDGGRIISAGESFTVLTPGKRDLKIVMRTDVDYELELEVVVDTKWSTTWFLKARDKETWHEHELLIPAEAIRPGNTQIEILYHWNHMYRIFHRPFYYWFLQEKESGE